MKFIINTTNLQRGGGLQVALSLLDEWNLADNQHEYHVFLSPQLTALIDTGKFNSNFRFYFFVQNPTSSVVQMLTFHKKLCKQEALIQPDAVLTVFGPALWKPRTPHLLGFANGYYLFDRSNFIQNKVLTTVYKRIKYYSRRFLLFHRLGREAGHYWVETPDAQKRLAQTINKPLSSIKIVGNTYARGFRNKTTETRPQNKRFTLLYLSAYYLHKNFELITELITILEKQNAECTFILTLPEPVFIKLFGGGNHYIRNIGPVNPNDAHQLYADCDAVFMPSLLETFSANYAEAMAAHKPLMASDLFFARNICGNAALYFNPEDPSDAAAKIIALQSSHTLQKQLALAGDQQLKQMETPGSRAKKIRHILEQIAFPKN